MLTLFSRLSRILIFSFVTHFCLGAVPPQQTTTLKLTPKAQAGHKPQVKRRIPSEKIPDERSAYLEETLKIFRASFAAGNYEGAFLQLTNAAGMFYTANNFSAAMDIYRIFANFADPSTTIDPSEAKEEVIRKSTAIKDMSRNYVKFMINCHLVRRDLCQANNCLDLGWEMQEKIKSRLLRIELINSALSRLDQRSKQEVANLMVQAKQERLARTRLRLATGNLIAATEKDLIIARIELEITRHLPEYTSLASEAASPNKIREILADNETLLSFFYTNNNRHVYAWKLQRDDSLNLPPVVIKTDILTADLFVAIELIKKAVVSGTSLQDISGHLSQIYQRLITPLKLSPNRRLIIAVDQNLSALPFDIVPWKDGQNMMDSFEITYVPSASVFYYLRRNQRAKNANKFAYQNDYAGFGYAGGEGDSLTHTETEIENAARYMTLNSKVLNATEAGIYRHAPDIANARYLHFATHNYLVDGVDASFYLTFGAGAGEDGRLTSREIVTKLRNHAELTVLSSCETAQANDNYYIGQATPLDPQKWDNSPLMTVSYCICSYGESFSNLTGAFFASGSKHLLLTQWRIRDDVQTDIFISRFFRLLASGQTPASALREVKRAMKTHRPALWAGFILAGD